MSIADEKYVRLTTFTRDGRRKESPVWIAEVDNDALGFTGLATTQNRSPGRLAW
jgi:hypothetical protein